MSNPIQKALEQAVDIQAANAFLEGLHAQPLTCAWFALCVNPTTAVIEHPILGEVPCCTRCAERLDMTDRLVERAVSA